MTSNNIESYPNTKAITDKGLYATLTRAYLDESESKKWFETIVEHARWFRVKYKSERFGKVCETPCWTTFYGGHPKYSPYIAIPDWLKPLVDQVSQNIDAKFNAVLVRLYWDGNDEIAWHTDGRTFRGTTPTIASLSLGATARFELRRMTNVWPCAGDNGIDNSTSIKSLKIKNGDLLTMQKDTQKHWHHRVPKEPGRCPRLNINFRYILPDTSDSERGQLTYYKYMVHGDAIKPPSWSFDEIKKRQGGILNFVTNHRAAASHERIKGLSIKLKQPTSTSLSKDQRDYLAFNSTTDPETFLALPAEIQNELIINWKTSSKRKFDDEVKKKSRGPSGDKKQKRQGTIDPFFRKKS